MEEKGIVLVTGGAGFIGSHVVNHLVDKGYKVRILDDLSTGTLKNIENSLPNIEFIHGSILDQSTLAKAAEGCLGIFHLAAITSVQESIEKPEKSHEVNTRGTLNILEIARKNKAKLIFSSTAAYYGDHSECLPHHEYLPPGPISPYGAQKVLSENYIQFYHKIHGLNAISLRYFNVYGPRQKPSGGYAGVIKIFQYQASIGKPLTIFGDGKQIRDFIYVGDVARANVLAFESKFSFGIFNVGTGIPIEIGELAKKVNQMLKAPSSIEYKDPRPGDILKSYSNPKLAEAKLGFKAEVSLEEGIQVMLSSES